MTLEIFKVDFLDRFVPEEMREEKVFAKDERVSMITLWHSLSCPNMLLIWSPILETK